MSLPLFPYTERLEFLVYPNGLRVLLPDEWDLAIQRATIAGLEEQAADLKAQNGQGDPDQLRALEGALRAERRRLTRMEAPPDTEGAQSEAQEFVLRPFTHGERLAADDAHTTVDPARGRRDLDVNARNLALLKLVLVKPEGLDPAELPDATCGTLIRRMWNRNAMNPELAVYFRGGRREAGPAGDGDGGAGGTAP